MPHSHFKPSVEQASKSDLQREALHYLKEFGPLNWGELYVRFDEAGSGVIGAALLDLHERKCIEIGSDYTVKITAGGMAQLNAGQ